MKGIYQVAILVTSMVMVTPAWANTPHEGGTSAHTTAGSGSGARHVRGTPTDPAVQERIRAVRADYRGKREQLVGELKTQATNLRNLERARPRDNAAITEARSQVKSTREQIKLITKQEQTEIAKVLAEAAKTKTKPAGSGTAATHRPATHHAKAPSTH